MIRTLAALLLIVLAGATVSHSGANLNEETLFSPGVDAEAVSVDAPYTARLSATTEERPITYLFYDLTAGELLGGYGVTRQMPVVSAIKGPILLYFMAHVDSTVWASVPVEYWTADRSNVPDAYLADWDAHNVILRALYRMIVNSDNPATGDVLVYAHEWTPYQDTLNPIEAFNRWSEDMIGTTPQSGLREWDEGGTSDPTWIDDRFETRTTLIYGVPRFYNNTVSTLDLARYYVWLYDEGDPDMVAQAIGLMSIVPGFPNFLETMAFDLDGIPVSKDGFVGPGDRNNEDGEYLTADAGLILLPERDLLVVTMAVNGGDRLDELYAEMTAVIREQRGEIFWPATLDFTAWMRQDGAPIDASDLSSEGLNFILAYLTDLGLRPVQGRAVPAEQAAGVRARYQEARDVWLAIFPDDRVPTERNAAQARVMAARYGGSGERLPDIAADLGLISPEDEESASP